MMRLILAILGIITLLSACSESIVQKDIEFFLSEPTMILNQEQDNSIEGTYLMVREINKNDSTIELELPNNFHLNANNIYNWTIGWGKDKAYYDAGVENIRLIREIDLSDGTISLGRITRGSGFPKKGQRVVFWNRNPSSFKNERVRPILDTKMWPSFAGSSVAFGAIEFDPELNKWVMFVNEVDTSSVQVYAAMSSDLLNWEAANNGEPLFTSEDFKTISWAGLDKSGQVEQSAIVSDVEFKCGKWHLIMDGFDKNGYRHIGIAISSKTILGPYRISPDAILSPGKRRAWNSQAVFYGKIEDYKDGYIMFYDGMDAQGRERIGMATSPNLYCWTNAKHNPVINQHTGWRSSPGTTEPNYIKIKGDTILLMCAGVKEFNNGFWSRYITGDENMGRSGNVSDAQLGLFMSIDEGKSFIQSGNNPIFTNDYSNRYENEHMGGNFRRISTDSVEFIFYQAKSSFPTMRYNIMLRERPNW